MLLEAAGNLGGRASSFLDRASGLMIDRSPHVILGCCTQTLDFLAHIGSLGEMLFAREAVFVEPRRRTRLAVAKLPRPLHLLGSLLSLEGLSGAQKRATAGALMRLVTRSASSDESALDYLAATGFPAEVVARLLEPILVSALNENLDAASASYARWVLRKTLLGPPEDCTLGVHQAPLSTLIADPAEKQLRERGWEVRKRCRVTAIDRSGGGPVRLELASGETLEAEQCVCAVPPDALQRMGLPAWGGDHLRWRAIVCASLFFESWKESGGCAFAVGLPFSWVCDSGRAADDGTRLVTAIASAAAALIGLPQGELTSAALESVRRVFPQNAALEPVRAVITRSRRATFSTADNVDIHRPASAAPGGRLIVAGDWTDTSWPATLESAVRSGRTAARMILDRTAH